MTPFEYRVLPAPAASSDPALANGADTQFSSELQGMMNALGADGWEYLRAETLPSNAPAAWPAAAPTWHTVLIFRRARELPQPLVLQQTDLVSAPPSYPTEPAAPLPEPVAAVHVTYSQPATPQDDASGSEGAARMLSDNGVEEISDVSGVTNSLMQLAAYRKSLKSDN